MSKAKTRAKRLRWWLDKLQPSLDNNYGKEFGRFLEAISWEFERDEKAMSLIHGAAKILEKKTKDIKDE